MTQFHTDPNAAADAKPDAETSYIYSQWYWLSICPQCGGHDARSSPFATEDLAILDAQKGPHLTEDAAVTCEAVIGWADETAQSVEHGLTSLTKNFEYVEWFVDRLGRLLSPAVTGGREGGA